MKRALFLDRDGVVNKVIKRFSKPYGKFIDDSPFNVTELSFNEEIKKLVDIAKSKGYEIVIVTNQPSILKGNFSMRDYEEITTKICQYLEINRSNVLECFHKEGLSLPCNCRKPKPGLIMMAKGMFDLDLKNSVFIGDSWKDILGAQYAGINKKIFVRRDKNNTQIGNLEDEEKMKIENINPDKIINSLDELFFFYK